MITLAAIISLALLLALTIFQILLIFGAPLGKFAWGGAHKVLPKKLRIASVSSIAIYVMIALFVAARNNFFDVINNETVVSVGLWVLFAYFVSGILLNGISKSKYERLTMTPVCVVLAVCFFVLAMYGWPSKLN